MEIRCFKGRITYKTLKQNNAFSKYIRNVLGEWGSAFKLDKTNIIDFLEENGVSGAFLWEDTEEGEDYWCNIDDKIDINLEKYE
jgi:hypothetical protein